MICYKNFYQKKLIFFLPYDMLWRTYLLLLQQKFKECHTKWKYAK